MSSKIGERRQFSLTGRGGGDKSTGKTGKISEEEQLSLAGREYDAFVSEDENPGLGGGGGGGSR